MLSYTWRYKIGDIVDSLKEYCVGSKLSADSTYIWMCCFCINQHRVRAMIDAGKSVPFEEFKAEFGSRVESIGAVIALMSPWASLSSWGKALSRSSRILRRREPSMSGGVQDFEVSRSPSCIH